jgi:hypothetical protein
MRRRVVVTRLAAETSGTSVCAEATAGQGCAGCGGAHAVRTSAAQPVRAQGAVGARFARSAHVAK